MRKVVGFGVWRDSSGFCYVALVEGVKRKKKKGGEGGFKVKKKVRVDR